MLIDIYLQRGKYCQRHPLPLPFLSVKTTLFNRTDNTLFLEQADALEHNQERHIQKPSPAPARYVSTNTAICFLQPARLASDKIHRSSAFLPSQMLHMRSRSNEKSWQTKTQQHGEKGS
jgi:hypothetical protein